MSDHEPLPLTDVGSQAGGTGVRERPGRASEHAPDCPCSAHSQAASADAGPSCHCGSASGDHCCADGAADAGAHDGDAADDEGSCCDVFPVVRYSVGCGVAEGSVVGVSVGLQFGLSNRTKVPDFNWLWGGCCVPLPGLRGVTSGQCLSLDL